MRTEKERNALAVFKSKRFDLHVGYIKENKIKISEDQTEIQNIEQRKT